MFTGIIQSIGSLLDSNNNEYKIITKLDLSDSIDLIILCSESFFISSNITYFIVVPVLSPLIMLINEPFFNILKTLKGILFSLHKTTAVVSITFNSLFKT